MFTNQHHDESAEHSFHADEQSVERSGVWYIPAPHVRARARRHWRTVLRQLGTSLVRAIVRWLSPRRALVAAWRRHAQLPTACVRTAP